jgi:hypothetical protein
MKALRRVSMLMTMAILATAGTAAADSVYHSERLPFAGGADPAFHGQVVNIHANGPHGLHQDRGPDYELARQWSCLSTFQRGGPCSVLRRNDYDPMGAEGRRGRRLRYALHHRDHRLTRQRRISGRSQEPSTLV